MDIQLKKYELIEWMTQISDFRILSEIEKIQKKYISKTNKESVPLTIDEFYNSVEKAEDDIKQGRIYTQEEVEKMSENW